MFLFIYYFHLFFVSIYKIVIIIFSSSLWRSLKAANNSLESFYTYWFLPRSCLILSTYQILLCYFLTNWTWIKIWVNISYLDSNVYSSKYSLRSSPTHSFRTTRWYLFDTFIIKYLNLKSFYHTNGLVI